MNKDNSGSNTDVCVCVCMCVFMAAARSPAGRVLGPAERATTPSASAGISSAPLWRKPEFVSENKKHEINK